jgi:hypothetical protein
MIFVQFDAADIFALRYVKKFLYWEKWIFKRRVILIH